MPPGSQGGRLIDAPRLQLLRIRRALGEVVTPACAEAVMEEALRGRSAPSDPIALAAFVEHPLRDVLTWRFGPELANLLVLHLGRVLRRVALASTARSQGG